MGMKDRVRRAYETIRFPGEPEYEGPTAATAPGGRIERSQSQDKVAAEFEENVSYGDPERAIPEEMDGVIRIKTASEAASEVAYVRAVQDPTSVLGPRERQQDEGPHSSGEEESVQDLGHRLERRRVTAGHDSERMARIKAALGQMDSTVTGSWDEAGLTIEGDPAYTAEAAAEAERAAAFDARAIEPDEVER
jgi:hypothetical protein